MSPLASAMAATTSSRAAPGALRRERSRSTARALATSPARWPPMPSATAKTRGSATRLSSFSGRIRPGSVAAPQRSVATTGPPAPCSRPGCGRRGAAGGRRRGGCRCGTSRWSSRGPRPSPGRRRRRSAGVVLDTNVSSSMMIVEDGSRPIVISCPSGNVAPRRALGSTMTRRATRPPRPLAALRAAPGRRRRRPCGACSSTATCAAVAPAVGAAHLAPHGPQDAGEEEVEQAQQDQLEDVEAWSVMSVGSRARRATTPRIGRRSTRSSRCRRRRGAARRRCGCR